MVLLITTSLQIFVYIVISEITPKIMSYLMQSNPTQLDWGLTYRFSIVVLAITVITGNVIFTYVFKRTKYLDALLVAVSIIAFGSFFVNDISYRPLRTSLLLLAALMALLLKPVIDRKVRRSDAG